MRALALILFVVASRAIEEELPTPLEGMQSLMIHWLPEQIEIVKKYEDTPGFDFVKMTRQHADVLVSADKVESFKQFLEANNIEYDVMIQNMKDQVMEEYLEQQYERLLKTRSQSGSPSGQLSFTYYPNVDEVNSYLEYVASTYSDVASLIDIGTSFEGKRMRVLKLSRNRKKNPAIFVDAGIHAREWIAPITSLFIVDRLVGNQTHSTLLDNVDWYIVPLMNPDGYQFTHENSKNRLWRKTRSNNTNSSCRGVDGNRNFDMEWMTIGSSSNPCSDTYAGPKAFSEPETQNIRNFILSRKSTIKLYMTLHSYGKYILYPWGYTTALPPNEPELRALAAECARAIASVRKTQYTYGTAANALYPASGGSDDWAMDKAGVDFSYTYELPGGRSGFVLPPSQIKPVGIETFEAVKVIHGYVKSKYSEIY